MDPITFPIEVKGKINFIFNGRLYIFCDVLYSSKLQKNVISAPHIGSKGGHYIGKDRKVMVFGQRGEHMFSAQLMNGTYYIFPKIQIPHNKVNPNSDKKISNSNQVSSFNVISINT